LLVGCLETQGFGDPAEAIKLTIDRTVASSA
jgi:hypothetical protein